MNRLVAATALSQVGSEVTAIALPLTAILVLNASAFQAGLLYSAEYIPLALFGLLAGAWADRIRRRRAMIAADLVRAALIAIVPLAYLSGHLTLALLYATAIAVGLLSVFFDAARGAFVPELIEPERLTTANSRLQTAEQGAGIVGPGLGGLLAGTIGAPLALAVDAASYLVSGSLLAAIPAIESRPQRKRVRELPREIGEGLRFLTGNLQLRAITLSAALANLFGRMVMAVLAIYLVRVAGLRPAGIGIVMSVGSAGFVLGALAAPVVAQRLGRTTTIRAGAIVASAAFLLIALPPPAMAGPFAAAGSFTYGFGALLFTVNSTTLRQTLTPREMLGRISASAKALTWGTIPIAAALGGWLATLLGLRPMMLIAALAALSACLPVLLAPLGQGQGQQAAQHRHRHDEEQSGPQSMPVGVGAEGRGQHAAQAEGESEGHAGRRPDP